MPVLALRVVYTLYELVLCHKHVDPSSLSRGELLQYAA